MADQDQRLALFLEHADDVFDLGRFLHAKRRRGFVHDGQLGMEGRGAGNGDALTLSARHVADRIVDVGNFHRRLFEPRQGRFSHGTVIEQPEGPQPIPLGLFAPEEEIVGHVQVIGQSERLEHGLDPRFAGFERPFELDLLPVEPDLAARALLDRRDLAHEGRLAGAVVAHDCHVLAPADLEIRIFQSVHAAIVLGQALRLEDDVAERRFGMGRSRARNVGVHVTGH